MPGYLVTLVDDTQLTVTCQRLRTAGAMVLFETRDHDPAEVLGYSDWRGVAALRHADIKHIAVQRR